MQDLFEQVPSSVYRLQLSASFGFQDAITLLPYLHELGVDGLYCSPVFDAVTPGGYDLVDPNRIAESLGGRGGFDALCSALKAFQIKHLLDVVPNHMGIRGRKNFRWIDVLEKGRESSYSGFFDIDWNPVFSKEKNKVFLPILGGPYWDVLRRGEISLCFEERFWIRYSDFFLPLAEGTLPDSCDQKDVLAFYQGGERVERLHALLEKQHYRLLHWVEDGEKINYRRFFNINELISISMEKEEVIEAHHKLLFELLSSNQVQGLRIDHPDGLYDPSGYFEKLREHRVGFVLAEKILAFGEKLPESWPVEGTVGYDFLNILGGLFVRGKNEKAFSEIYEEFIGHQVVFSEVLYHTKKRYILENMGSVLSSLSEGLVKILAKEKEGDTIPCERARELICELFAVFSIYRSYVGKKESVSKADRITIEKAFCSAQRKAPQLDKTLFDRCKKLFFDDRRKEADVSDWIARFQQFSAPAMAKGLEDCALYRYNRLASLNEVGGDPDCFGTSKELFHTFQREKQEHWPLSSLCSSTHDTKWSEDARMRLHALSEIPHDWQKTVSFWKELNDPLKRAIGTKLFPDPNLEYFLYQLLLALWPLQEEEARSLQFYSRVEQSLLKSMREAGQYTSWRTPDDVYESACMQFVESLFKLKSDSAFFRSFLPFQRKLALAGEKNSLSALILRAGSSGILDVYQGNELFHFSHVDPDNRREVDFLKRQALLQRGSERKLQMLSCILKVRREHRDLFLLGEYIPLEIEEERVIGWIRRYKKQIALILGGRFFMEEDPIRGDLYLPEECVGQKMTNIFTGQSLSMQKRLPLQPFFEKSSGVIFLL